MQEVLNGLSVGLVPTAHPTEATRRGVRRKHERVGETLASLESPSLTWRGGRRLEEGLAKEITVLWQTDELRVRPPKVVVQEIERTLLFFEHPLVSATLKEHGQLPRQTFMQMTLAKSGLRIARTYTSLVSEGQIVDRMWVRISEEHAACVEALLLITENENLLDDSPILQRPIRFRNPYVDPLSYAQVNLLRRLRGLCQNTLLSAKAS